MGLKQLLKQAKEYLPEKLFKEIEQMGYVEKGIKSGSTAESGSHAHALIRNQLRTMADGRHRHIYAIRNTNGEISQITTELDGEHEHLIDEETSKKTGSSASSHQHVVRMHTTIELENGESLKPGMAFITKLDGEHSHGSEMLETTNYDGAHKHVLELPGGMTLESIDIEEFWEIFGPFDLEHISPIYSTDQIYDRFSHPCEVPIMKSYSGYMDVTEDLEDWQRVLAASMGKDMIDKEEIIFKANEVHEIILSKDIYKSEEDAMRKAIEMEYQVSKNDLDNRANEYRVRVGKSSDFLKDTYRELQLSEGVKVISGVLKGNIKKATEIQTLIFPKDKFTEDQARKFAKRNDFKGSKVDETGTSYRLRQRNPDDFERLRTISLPGSEGVKAVVGPVKKEAAETDFDRIVKECPEQIPIMKEDDEKRIVTGIVLEPDVVDSQGDTISEDDIEKAAAFFIQKSRTIGFRHSKKAPATLVGSMVMPASFTINKGPNGKQKVKKGSWLISVHVQDDKLWEAVKKKKINAFSVGGFGSRTPISKEKDGFGAIDWFEDEET